MPAYGEVGLNVGGGMYVGEDCGSAAPIPATRHWWCEADDQFFASTD